MKIEKGMVFTVNGKSNRYFIGDILANGYVEIKWVNEFSKEIDSTSYKYEQVIRFIENGGWVIDYNQLRKDKLKKLKMYEYR